MVTNLVRVSQVLPKGPVFSLINIFRCFLLLFSDLSFTSHRGIRTSNRLFSCLHSSCLMKSIHFISRVETLKLIEL